MLAGAAPAPPARQSAEPRVIDVVARRFSFEPPVIEATEGERIRLAIRSADGLHGIEVKELRISKEIPRGGAPVTVDFVAERTGSFQVLCSLYCGNGHGDMKGMLVVQARERTE